MFFWQECDPQGVTQRNLAISAPTQSGLLCEASNYDHGRQEREPASARDEWRFVSNPSSIQPANTSIRTIILARDLTDEADKYAEVIYARFRNGSNVVSNSEASQFDRTHWRADSCVTITHYA